MEKELLLNLREVEVRHELAVEVIQAEVEVVRLVGNQAEEAGAEALLADNQVVAAVLEVAKEAVEAVQEQEDKKKR